MKDLALNSDFSVFIDDRNDLGQVEGQDAFEQQVVVMLTDFMHEQLPGIAADPTTVKEKIRLEVSRVARENGHIDRIAKIDVTQKDTDRFEVEIHFIAAESFAFDLHQ